METVTMMNNIMENTPKDIIIIDSDEEDNVDIPPVPNINNNDKANDSTSGGIVSIVAVYSLVNTNELDNKKCDIENMEPAGSVTDEPAQEDTTLPKIVAVTSGINVIHNDFTNTTNMKTTNNIEVLTIESAYSDVESEDLKYKSKMKKYLPEKMHIRNRIQHIINKRLGAFRKCKHYATIKSCIKKFPRRRSRTRTMFVKRNIRRFNTSLPVKVNATHDSRWNALIQEIKSLKKCDSVRTEIMEQLKIFREKCFKQSDSESALQVMDEFMNSMDTKKDTDKIIKTPQTVVMVDEQDAKKDSQLKEYVPVPCCSKTLDDISPTIPSTFAVTKKLQENTARKTNDLTKYKSLKYKQLANNNQEDATDEKANKIPSENESSAIISAVKKINDAKRDNISISRNTNAKAPDIDDVLQRLRDMRHHVVKISEEDDILSRLKSDRTGGQFVDTDMTDLPRLDANDKLSYASEKCHNKDDHQPPKSKMMVSSKPTKTRNTTSTTPEDICGPVKIALPNGRLVKPKTLAEKRRLLRREFETEMRGRMQVNEQLLERQLLRQKSNNRRTESSEVRERLLQDNAPMTRANWNGVTELLSSSDTAFSKQFMIVDGRYVRICGSRGGEKRFIPPPPPTTATRRRTTPLDNTHKQIDCGLVPRFLPGPMSKKHLLIRKTPQQDDDVQYCSKKLPKIYLEVQTRPGEPLCQEGRAYMMKLAFASNIVDCDRAKFAVTALVDGTGKKLQIASETHKFPINYRDDQERILMRRLAEPKTDEIVVEKTTTTALPPPSDDKAVVSDMISGMFDYVETSLLADGLVLEDPDAKTPPPSSASPVVVQNEQSTESTKSSVASLRARAAHELRRLNVTVFEASDQETHHCKEPHCSLGCVCTSLKCLQAGAKRHCGNVECMFECRCSYTHRLRQKRSLRQNNNNTSNQDDDNGGEEDNDMLELKDRVRSGLARVEAEFKHAVVVNQDKSVTLVDGDSDKRKRCVKMPKRFDDFISSDLATHQQQFNSSPYASPVKKQQDDYYYYNQEITTTTRRPTKTPIIPKEKLLAPRKLVVRLHNLALDDVEPWCMVHELYRCFCDCTDAYGEPFADDAKRRSSLDNNNKSTTQEPNESGRKETRNSIKTLSRTILLDVDENDTTTALKKNWHVELFSSDHQEQVEQVQDKPRQALPVVKRKSASRMSFTGFDSDASSLRRKSNDSIKRKRSSEDLDKDKRETTTTTIKDVVKRPRLQVKSPWDLNQMADKMSDKISKFNAPDSILLREFALSTTSVVDPNAKDIAPPPSMSKFETSIRLQREHHNRSMRCARIYDSIIYRVASMITRNRKRAPCVRRLTETTEENNPSLLRRLNLLVKRSQIVSQQRGLKTGNIIPLTARQSNEPSSRSSNNNNLSYPEPPPLKPAPVLLQTTAPTDSNSPKVVNMVTSTLPAKEQKQMSTVVNREILRMLNQKGALDADFDLTEPRRYRFQCMQWHTMLCKYKRGDIRLWLETSPEKSSTMALLTTGYTPPFPNCIDMSALNAAAEKGDGKVYVPKFAKKIHTDCLNIGDAKHKAQYVFMRAHQTYWTLEGVIERGHNPKNTPPQKSNADKKHGDYITIRPKSDLYAAETEKRESHSPSPSPPLSRAQQQLRGIVLPGNNKPERDVAEERSYQLNAELLRTRTEIEARLVDPNKRQGVAEEPTESPTKSSRRKNVATPGSGDSEEQSPIELIPCKRPRRSVTHRFEKAQHVKRSHRSSPVLNKSNASDSSEQSDRSSRKITMKSTTAELPRKFESHDDDADPSNRMDNFLSKRPFTIERINNSVNGQYENNDVGDHQITIIKQRKRIPICINDDKMEDEEQEEQPQVQISNVSSTNEMSSPLAAGQKLEALPFAVGMRYLFVSMNETFGLLTSSRNGYRVTYLQLASAIQTAICRNVYVRLKFKQYDLNHDAHGVVFAVPWCKDGVFIGPYGLTEQCMITKQIYWRNKLIGLSEYTRTIENREPKPVGYWMCYYGDDRKFVRAYHSLMKRLSGLDKKPSEAQRDEIAENKKVIVKIKGASPNSVLKANLDKIRANIGSPSSADETKFPVAVKLAASTTKPNTILAKTPPSSKKKPAILELFNESLSSNHFEMKNTAEQQQNEEDDSKNFGSTTKTGDDNTASSSSFVSVDTVRAAPSSPGASSLSNMSNEINESSLISDMSNVSANNDESARTGTLDSLSSFAKDTTDNTGNNTSDDDEPELMIEEKVQEVIDLSSDSEDGDETATQGFGGPGIRWLYCDVEGIGYLEVQVLSSGKLSVQLPMVSTQAEFDDLKKASIWINSILKKIVYFLPNSFLPTWKMADSPASIKKLSTHIPRKMGTDIFQGNFVIYKHTLIDLSNQKNIDDRIKDPNDHALATKYAEHYISRYIKHALGLKFSSRLTQEQLAAAACTEIKSINDVEAKLVDQKKMLLKQRTELVQRYKVLNNANADSTTAAKMSNVGRAFPKNSNSPKTDKVDTVSSNLIVIDD